MVGKGCGREGGVTGHTFGEHECVAMYLVYVTALNLVGKTRWNCGRMCVVFVYRSIN